jgi:hypothetical protein
VLQAKEVAEWPADDDEVEAVEPADAAPHWRCRRGTDVAEQPPEV